MPDPSEIIAETILKPPPQTGHHDEGFAWQFTMAMGNPAAPDFARHIAEAAVQALTDAGYTLVPPAAAPNGTLPSPEQIRNWLTRHDWKAGSQGSAGTTWHPPVKGRGVGVPDDDSDPALTAGAIERIAGRVSMSAAQVAAEMLTYAGE